MGENKWHTKNYTKWGTSYGIQKIIENGGQVMAYKKLYKMGDKLSGTLISNLILINIQLFFVLYIIFCTDRKNTI